MAFLHCANQEIGVPRVSKEECWEKMSGVGRARPRAEKTSHPTVLPFPGLLPLTFNFQLLTLPAPRTAPDQVANGDDDHPRGGRQQSYVELWYPPRSGQHAKQCDQPEQRTPRARWGEAQD